MSLAQQRLWSLDQLEPGLTAYNMARAFRLRGALDVGALKRALEEIVRRHEILRTTFQVEFPTPVQKIATSSELALTISDLTDSDPDE